MNFYDLIIKKRDGKVLSKEEIHWMIDEYTRGEIPEYQMAAMAMAIYFQGMEREETAQLAEAMAQSGQTMDLSSVPGIKVDKHSTGGVGDKVSLILIPLLASLGYRVAKMSGRGLGHTGGTIDKLECIPGFDTSLEQKRFFRQIQDIGMALAGQTHELAPADKKLYSLRDVTGTVDSIPLIASSIMSKKLAGGAQRIVLDVKVGDGAFMKDLEEATLLARTMVDIGRQLGRETMALLTSMDEPLGRAVGNSIEVNEAVAVLQGNGPDDVREVVLALAAATCAPDQNRDLEEIKKDLAQHLDSDAPWKAFCALIESQGGKAEFPLPLDQPLELKAKQGGYVTELRASRVGQSSVELGAGRKRLKDRIFHGVGIELHKKYGDRVEANETLATLYYCEESDVDRALELLEEAYTIGREKPVQRPKLYKYLEDNRS